MAPSELRRKLVFLFTVILIVSAILVILPFIEAWFLQSVYSQFNLFINDQGDVLKTLPNGSVSRPSQLTQTILGLSVNLFKIIKIILFLSIVVAVVRVIVNLVFSTALRNTAQNEIASLLKTVLSVIVYIVAFFIIFQAQYPNIPLAPLFTGSTIL